MNQTELNKYRATLETKQTELSAGLRNRYDIAIEKTPDALDEVQLAGERELAIRNLDRFDRRRPFGPACWHLSPDGRQRHVRGGLIQRQGGLRSSPGKPS